ncbi:MAG TPA: histidine phosphatase family protein [Rudaea sp.]|jgi:phosphohistidine phosphatase SixA|nr:histidine phosphatase family protein [Rudaea sp.]
MKREVILLRHAHAEGPNPGQGDADRPLSARGIDEAKAAGRWLRGQTVLPALVLCSPALRARQTLQHALGDVAATSEPRIYEASAGELIALIDDHVDAARLLLVGHNPGFETLVALLATGQSGDFRGVPPAGIAWFEIDGTAEPGAGRLEAFWSP